MKKNNYINYIKKISEEAKEKILKSWVLNNVESLTYAQLTLFFIQFNYFVNKFPRYIGAMIYNSDHPLVRNILVKNLIDELGGHLNIQKNDIAAAHCSLYGKFLRAFGIKDEMLAASNPLPCTLKFIKNCDQIYLNSPITKSLSAFGPGNEGIPKWHKIYHYLKNSNYREEDLKFFSVHMAVDSGHNDEIIAAILLTIKNDEDLALTREGAMAMINARYDFYNDLYKEMKKLTGLDRSRHSQMLGRQLA